MPNPLDKMRKLNSRLRCVANGKSNVNAVRAQQNGAVRVTTAAQKLEVPDLATMTAEQSVKHVESSIGKIWRGPKQKSLPDDVEVSVFVLLNRDTAKTPAGVKRRNGRVGTAMLKLSELHKLDADPSVQSIELAETLAAPNPHVASTVPVQPAPGRYANLNSGTIRAGALDTDINTIGQDVLVGIIDVGGIDFAHEDFLDANGKSRVIAIWDQGGDAFDPPDLFVSEGRATKGKGRGSEIKASDIQFALDEAKAARVSPYDLAPQSQRIVGSHATHVASIAAGNSGICKRARIAAVLVSLPDEELDRSKSFYDTTCIVDGLTYLFALADADPTIKAISINISLGTNGGSHDGAELLSRWVDGLQGLEPMGMHDEWPWSRVSGARDLGGKVRLIYFGEHQPNMWTTGLPTDDGSYEVDLIDTWAMTVTPAKRIEAFVPHPQRHGSVVRGGKADAAFGVELPGRPNLALRVRKLD